MGIRGIIKDALITYLAIIIIISAFKTGEITTSMVIISIILLAFVLWFLLERVGILEQM
ncbi:MAG: hypothetical protein V1645_02090 [archaeon]